jgi:hypothetical protein
MPVINMVVTLTLEEEENATDIKELYLPLVGVTYG